MVQGSVVLLGDAAYCRSLLAGEAATFAMAGAYLLAHELASAEGDYVKAYAEYLRQFKPVHGEILILERFQDFAMLLRLGGA